MTSIVVQRSGFEKFSVPAQIAGLTAEVAEVTRQFEIDVDTSAEKEIGTPTIVPLWGVSAVTLAAKIDEKKAQAAEEYAAQIARYDGAKSSLDKSAAAKAG